MTILVLGIGLLGIGSAAWFLGSRVEMPATTTGVASNMRTALSLRVSRRRLTKGPQAGIFGRRRMDRHGPSGRCGRVRLSAVLKMMPCPDHHDTRRSRRIPPGNAGTGLFRFSNRLGWCQQAAELFSACSVCFALLSLSSNESTSSARRATSRCTEESQSRFQGALMRIRKPRRNFEALLTAAAAGLLGLSVHAFAADPPPTRDNSPARFRRTADTARAAGTCHAVDQWNGSGIQSRPARRSGEHSAEG